MDVYVGLDIGGTKLMVMSVDKNGNEIIKVKYPTPEGFQE
ncbi:MAG: putative NBD/HSP70 family sugar kinase [Francisellaceae bacterium]|jgi:predicted NBD/HSP70 family sugar kinase